MSISADIILGALRIIQRGGRDLSDEDFRTFFTETIDRYQDDLDSDPLQELDLTNDPPNPLG